MGTRNSGGKLWTSAEPIAYMSLGEQIQPGDVIGFGTMGGGSALELGRLEAGGIGVLRSVMGSKIEGL